jgi:hypothetical protein
MIAGDVRPYDETVLATVDHLALAKSRLDKFAAVGINEAFLTSIKLAFVMQGWPFDAKMLLAPPGDGDCGLGQKKHCHDMAAPNGHRKSKGNRPDYKTFLNATFGSGSDEAATTALLHETNALDQALWEYARDKLCANLQLHKSKVIDGDPKVTEELRTSAICPDFEW